MTWFEFEFFSFDLPLHLTSFFFLFSCYNIKKVRPGVIEELKHTVILEYFNIKE